MPIGRSDSHTMFLCVGHDQERAVIRFVEDVSESGPLDLVLTRPRVLSRIVMRAPRTRLDFFLSVLQAAPGSPTPSFCVGDLVEVSRFEALPDGTDEDGVVRAGGFSLLATGVTARTLGATVGAIGFQAPRDFERALDYGLLQEATRAEFDEALIAAYHDGRGTLTRVMLASTGPYMAYHRETHGAEVDDTGNGSFTGLPREPGLYRYQGSVRADGDVTGEDYEDGCVGGCAPATDADLRDFGLDRHGLRDLLANALEMDLPQDVEASGFLASLSDHAPLLAYA